MRRWADLAAVALVGTAVLCVFGRCLGYGFLSWDDDVNITNNAALLAGDWRRFWLAPYQALYIPPVYTVWAWLAQLRSPLHPALFHGCNVAMHFVNAALVYAIARLCLRRELNRCFAVAAALLFALHPLQIETVAWVSGLRDLLCATWSLSAVLCYLLLAAPATGRSEAIAAAAVAGLAAPLATAGGAAAAASAGLATPLATAGGGAAAASAGLAAPLATAGGGAAAASAGLAAPLATAGGAAAAAPAGKAAHAAVVTATRWLVNRSMLWSLATMCYLLAVLCKPGAIALPFALLVYEGCQRRGAMRRALLWLGPWLLAAPPIVYFTRQMQSEALEQVGAVINIGERLLVVLDTYGFYLAKVLGPWGLAADYGRTPTVALHSSSLLAHVGLLGLFLAGAYGVWAWRGAVPWLAFGAALLLPTSGLVTFAYQHISTTADRYTYLPLAGFALALTSVLSQLRWSSAAGLLAASVCVLSLAATSVQRVGVWRDDASFYPAMAAANPHSFSAWIGLAAIALREQRFADGLAFVTKAQEIEPLNVAALADRGLALVRLGRYQQVLDDLQGKLPSRDMVQHFPLSAADMATLYMTVGYAMIKLGRISDSLVIICYARYADANNVDVQTFLPLVAKHLGKDVNDPELCPPELRTML